MSVVRLVDGVYRTIASTEFGRSLLNAVDATALRTLADAAASTGTSANSFQIAVGEGGGAIEWDSPNGRFLLRSAHNSEVDLRAGSLSANAVEATVLTVQGTTLTINAAQTSAGLDGTIQFSRGDSLPYLIQFAEDDDLLYAGLSGNLSRVLLAGDNLAGLADQVQARENLGLGSLATQNSNNVTITGGTISGSTQIFLPSTSISGAGAIYRLTDDIYYRDSTNTAQQLQRHSVYLDQITSGFSGASNNSVLTKSGLDLVYARPWTPVRYTTDDANYSIPANADIVAQIGTMTAARTLTLPSAVEVGRKIEIRNEGQNYDGCLDILIAPAPGESIEGLPVNSAIALPWGTNQITLVRNAASAPSQWSVLPSVPSESSYSLCVNPLFSAGTGSSSTIYYGNNASGGTSGGTSGYSESDAVTVFTTGTGTTGRGGLRTASIINTADGVFAARFRVGRVSALSNATESYLIILGFTSSPTGAAGFGSYGVVWWYTHSVNSGYWRGTCRNNSVNSHLSASFGPATNGAYQEFALWVNAAGTEVVFFVENTLLGSITTNIPSSTIPLSFDCRIQKTAGTNNRSISVSLAAMIKKNLVRP